MKPLWTLRIADCGKLAEKICVNLRNLWTIRLGARFGSVRNAVSVSPDETCRIRAANFRWKICLRAANRSVLKLFHKYASMVRACGPVHMIPQKTRVVFQVRMRFAGATPRKSYLLCHFILPRKIDNGRFYKIETFNPHCHAHYLRV